jgi:hypothetical protein
VVENTGKAPRADTYKPINVPESLTVEEDALRLPLVVRLKRREAVISIEDRWRLDDEWWRAEPVSRLYYSVLLTSGQRLVLYKDLITSNWYQQDY